MPFSILAISGVAALLLDATRTEAQSHIGTVTQSALTTTILGSACTHQQNASSRRLGVGPPKVTSTTSLGLGQFKNLSKAKAVQDERKAKKAEVQLRDVGIRVVATVWMSDKNKLTQVSLIQQELLASSYDRNIGRLDKSGCRASMSQQSA